MPTKEFHKKLHKLLDIPKCINKDYKRNPVDKKTREKIYKEQEGKCWICGCRTGVPQTHHIKPDGENERANLVMLCSNCHRWIHWILKKYLGYRGIINPLKFY